MNFTKLFARCNLAHHNAIHPTHKLVKVLQIFCFDFSYQLIKLNQIGIEYQTNVGQIILIIRREKVIARTIEFAVVLHKLLTVKFVAKHRIHCTKDSL